jgi:predicted GTPase
MSRWRIVVVAALLLVPFLALAGLGSYYLWTLGWGLYAWFPMAGCMMLAYLLGWHWQRKKQLLKPPDFERPHHWTERDGRAWKLVEERAKAGAKLDPAKFTDVAFYQTTAQEMAQELAAFYHPGAKDPVGDLTVPEILAVIELAAHDLGRLVDQYLPGGHLLTVKDWRRAKQATDWYQSASKIYWATSALFSPINTAVRYATSTIGLSTPLQMLQQNLLLWFYEAFVHRLGTYLIDLNSGRLRVGAARYRELLATVGPRGEENRDGRAPAADEADRVRTVTITLMGQVKAGKSSLANAILGDQRARTDVLPATAEVQRYELQPPDIPSRLVLLDTVGYGHAGPKADQIKATREAAQGSDLLLLVLHAMNPARQADLAMLQALRTWFTERLDLKMPPLIGVVAHMDLLSPLMEWAPPYNWERPTRPKEENIHECLAAVREGLGDYLAAVAPVCAAAGKEYGINEWLLPAVAERLDEVHGVALLRCLRAEADAGKIRKLFHQLLAAGKEMARIAWQGLKR